MQYDMILKVIILLGFFYNILLIFDKSYNFYDNKKESKSEKTKLWEKTTTAAVILILGILLMLVILKFNKLAYLYNIISFILYFSILFNIILKKDNNKISKRELSIVTLIPNIFLILYDSKNNYIILINEYIRINSITYFIIVKNIKYFMLIFFLTMNIFLVIMELLELITIKKIYKSDNKDFEPSKFIYVNCRGKKGYRFLFNYLKDILILVRLILNLCINKLLKYPIIYVCKVIKVFLKKITDNFSVYIIITKAFMISTVISLLLTYHKLLENYGDNIIVNMYSVIITTIIIPIIMNIVSDLKNEKKANN